MNVQLSLEETYSDITPVRPNVEVCLELESESESESVFFETFLLFSFCGSAFAHLITVSASSHKRTHGAGNRSNTCWRI
jgi:hypothetical protein